MVDTLHCASERAEEAGLKMKLVLDLTKAQLDTLKEVLQKIAAKGDEMSEEEKDKEWTNEGIREYWEKYEKMTPEEKKKVRSKQWASAMQDAIEEGKKERGC